MYAAFVLQLCILRLFILKTEGQTIYKKNSLQSYKTQIKIAYPGLA